MSECGGAGRPVVGIVTDHIDVDGVKTNTVRVRYVDALARTACVTPILLATSLNRADVELLVEHRLDGILLTGAATNVRPSRYSQPTLFDESLLDVGRDDLSFSMIDAAFKYGKPLLGICRGLQELNVAFGGTLHQDLTKVPHAIRHHEDLSLPRDEQYLPAHTISIAASGMLQNILRAETAPIEVNSLHLQGVDKLGGGLMTEAVAPDGLIEAISVADAKAPMLAIQWHLEWFHDTDPVSRAILRAFGELCREYRQFRSSNAIA